MSFATTLQTLRKEAGLTQEQLASKFGVSAQAVSKWENGSFPEGDLIPKIADQFGVSIDYLYGREEKKASLEQQVVRGLNAIWKEEGSRKEVTKRFMETVHRILWGIQISGWSENPDYFDRPQVAEASGELDSALLNEFGYSFMRLNKNHEWYLFLRQPDCEEGFLKWFEGAGKIVPMVKLLSDPESVRVLLYMYTLNNHEFAGAETVSKETGISKEKAEEALNKLTSEIGVCNHPLYRISIMKGSGKEETVYGIDKTLSGLLLGVLALLDTYCNAASSYSMHMNNREESWLSGLPKTGPKKEK